MKNKKSKKQIEFEKKRYDLGLKYAKTTFIRYSIAFLLVISIYWMFMTYISSYNLSLIVPVSYFILYSVCIADHFLSLHGHKKNEFDWSKRVMIITIISNFILSILTLIDYKMIFPYFKEFYIPLLILLLFSIIKYYIFTKIQNYINKK